MLGISRAASSGKFCLKMTNRRQLRHSGFGDLVTKWRACLGGLCLKTKLLGVAVAVALFGVVPKSSADIIEADFAGNATGFLNANLYHTTFTAQFFFDTAFATVQQTGPGTYLLSVPPSSSSGHILLAINGSPFNYDFQGLNTNGLLEWQDRIRTHVCLRYRWRFLSSTHRRFQRRGRRAGLPPARDLPVRV